MRLKVILAVMITVPLLLTCESNISDSAERPAEMENEAAEYHLYGRRWNGAAQMSSAFLYKKETPQ